MPNWFVVLAARAVAVQVVSESGYLTFTLAAPFASVFTSGSQRIVERKSLRTCTAGSWPGGGAGAPATEGINAFSDCTSRPLIGSATIAFSETLTDSEISSSGDPLRPTPNSATVW